MSALQSQPPREPIGYLANGQSVTIAKSWYRYLAVDLFNRVGGSDSDIQFKSEKGQPNGYAGLGATALVPANQLGTGTANASTYLRGDGTWAVVGTTGNSGTAIIDFGAWPGSNEASVVVTGQTGITPTTPVEAWLMAEASVDHTAQDATYAALFVSLTVSPPSGTSFTINARSEHKMQGQFIVRYQWAD